MRILVKHSDKLVSIIFNHKVVNQYSVYVMDDNSPIYPEMVYGEQNRDIVVSKLISKYLPDVSESDRVNYITEVSFFDFFNLSTCHFHLNL